mmetsp:Transcript_13256/g.48274  ORF Transcript_13256/g.48274 Transcript_13256/m.48274 type:complete len:427 (+) Transcript_13256:111-1391(+)
MTKRSGWRSRSAWLAASLLVACPVVLAASSEVEALPSYFANIEKFLAPWTANDRGIYFADISSTWGKSFLPHGPGGGYGARYRVDIIDEQLFVSKTHRAGCPESRIYFMQAGLLKLLKEFPGTIPNVTFTLYCQDVPKISKAKLPKSPDCPGTQCLPAMFSLCSSKSTLDIPWPCNSFFGWPETHIPEWKVIQKQIEEESTQIPWEQKQAAIFWRGRTKFGNPCCPSCGCNIRGELQSCQREVGANGLDAVPITWDDKQNGRTHENKTLSSHCKSQAMLYLEGHSYSASLKYIMACGAVTLRLDSEEYWEFFGPSLQADEHYRLIHVKEKGKGALCGELAEQLAWIRENPGLAKTIATNGMNFIKNDLSERNVLLYMKVMLQAYARLLKFTPEKAVAGQKPLTAEGLIEHAGSKQRAEYLRHVFDL